MPLGLIRGEVYFLKIGYGGLQKIADLSWFEKM